MDIDNSLVKAWGGGGVERGGVNGGKKGTIFSTIKINVTKNKKEQMATDYAFFPGELQNLCELQEYCY